MIVNDILQWDIKSWYKPLQYWDHRVDWNSVHNGLELGGREGGLSLWLALKDKAVICSDLVNTKNVAEALHTRYPISNRIVYQNIDATNIPYESHFDVIVFKSILGGIGQHDKIERQQQVFDEIHKALKPKGKLLFAENLIASPFHQQLRKRYVNWGGSWRYVSMPEMAGFLHKFSSFDLQSTGVLGAFGRSERQRRLLASVDQLLLNKICPASWNYIVYGIAEK